MLVRFLLGSFFVFFVVHAYATTSRCAAPSVDVRLLYEPANVYNRASVATLTAYANSTEPVVGLYRSHQRVHLNLATLDYHSIQGVCVNKIMITYSISHVIDIGREHPPGTCAYRETLAHERQHERIHIEQAAEAANYLRKVLSQRVLWFTGSDRAGALQRWLNNTAKYSEQVFKQFIKPAQIAFDSDKEYERFSKACGHELKIHMHRHR